MGDGSDPAAEAPSIDAQGRETAVWRTTTVSGRYGIVGLVVAVILILLLLRLLGVV